MISIRTTKLQLVVLLSIILLCKVNVIVTSLETRDEINIIQPSRLSRPPAPLFQGNGNTFITLFIRLDPNDVKDKRLFMNDNDNKNIDERTSSSLYYYELQMENRMKGSRGINGDENENVNANSDDEMSTTTTTTKTMGDFLGVWTDMTQIGKIVPTSNESQLYPVTVTIPNLSSVEQFR